MYKGYSPPRSLAPGGKIRRFLSICYWSKRPGKGESWSRGVSQPLLWRFLARWPPGQPGSRLFRAPQRASAGTLIPQVVDQSMAAWCSFPSTPGSCEGQMQTHSAPERKVHDIWRKCCGGVSRDGGWPCPCMWTCLGAQQRTVAGPNGRQQNLFSERNVECESSIPLPTICPHAGLAARRLRRRCS